jgi:hypothetical protein
LPAPTIGESPTRPGIFHDKPLVLVQLAMSFFSVTIEQWTVP